MSVGIARMDITPEYPIRLNGFLARKQESTGVRQRIWAKALAFGDDSSADGPAILITLDATFVSNDLFRETVESLQQRGIHPHRVSITATHTHSAPVIRNAAPTVFGEPLPPSDQAHVDQYTRELKEKLIQLVSAALDDRKPAAVAFNIGEVTFARNRRTAGGPVDHDLMALTVRSPDGALRAVYVSYACHCVTLSDSLINGDWAGYAAEHLERLAPDITALVSVGFGADSNPSSGVTGSNADAASAQGLEIASEVKRLLSTPWSPLNHLPTIQAAEIELPLSALPAREIWESKAKLPDAVGHHARVQLERLDRGESLASKIEYPIRTWQFGDQLAMVFLPGEIVVDYSARLKQELDRKRLWLNGYSNGCPGYVPSERILKEGGYEGGAAMIYFDIPGPYAPGLEQKIVGVVRKQLDDRFRVALDSKRTRGSVPRDPQQAIAAFKTLPNLKVELVAAEPLIASPVAIDFSADGRLWVAEMLDYPAGTQGDYQPGGRVRMLEDTDDDGAYDRSSIFLADIPFPTGVTAWRNGVLVCAAPDILFAEDTNHDGRADIVKKLFSGFGTENYQARVNSLRYGLDGWIYGSCGLYGGQIVNFRGESVALGNRDFRMHPDSGVLEPVTGTTQQGRARNDWGDWFGCDNSTLIRHYPLNDHYGKRNSFVAMPIGASFHFRDTDPGRLFPISQVTLFPLSGPPGRVTAACGLEIYRDQLLGLEWQGDAFTCEPVANLVHHLRLAPSGTTFAGGRAPGEEQQEVLASADPWFRPVQVRSGPDGALWIVDMYRFVIEHPRWIPPSTVAELDVRAGHDRGRIYRVLPREVNSVARGSNRIAQLDTAALVQCLDSANGWRRDTAQQLLVDKRDPSATALLAELAKRGDRPEARLHAICTLELLGTIDLETLRLALSDSHAGVRRHATRIAEGKLAAQPELAAAFLSLIDDSDPQVQLQLAYSLGEWRDKRAYEAIATLLLRHHGDTSLRWALMSSLTPYNFDSVVNTLLSTARDPEIISQLLPALIEMAPQLGSESLFGKFLELAVGSQQAAEPTFAMLREVHAAGNRRKVDWQNVGSPEIRKQLAARIDAAAQIAQDADQPTGDRLSAIRLLGVVIESKSQNQPLADFLAGLLTAQSSTEIQSAVVDALGQLSGTSATTSLLEKWESLTPVIRGQVLDVVLQRPDRVAVLLDSLADGRMMTSDLDAARRARLLDHADETLRLRAKTLLITATAADRQAVVEGFRDLDRLTPDPQLGKKVFVKTCAPCHQLEGIGHVVGQNLAALTNKSHEALLISIFDPSRQVDERFLAYVVATVDGRTLSGILARESSTSVTLRGQEGKETTLLRTEIESMKSTGKSLMPEGLERDLKPQDVANLLAYLAQHTVPPKALDGNRPSRVQANSKGILVLTAARAEIYGGDITFEDAFQNIGYWHAEGDRVDWSVEVPKRLECDIWIDYACDSGSAGNRFLIDGLSDVVRGEVESTDAWSEYRQRKIATSSLAAGIQRIVLRPDGPLKRGALMDLRTVVLAPKGVDPDWSQIRKMPRQTAFAVDPRFTTPAEYAQRILDPRVSDAERISMVQSQPQIAAELIKAMADGLAFGTDEASKEEYRRIPWIWRVAIGAGKRNEPGPVLKILEVALPADQEPLRDWQAVVIGGGIVNGISQSGNWPAERIETLIGDNPVLSARWLRSLELAAQMADDERINTGTRYDALRMLGAEPLSKKAAKNESKQVSRRVMQIAKYLSPDSHGELQMGAVSGLADVPGSESTAALKSALPDLTAENRVLAVEALLRTRERAVALSQAISEGKLKAEQLTEAQQKKLAEWIGRKE